MRAASFFAVACVLGLVAVAACSSSSSSDDGNPQPDAGDDSTTPPPGDDAGDAGSSGALFPTGGTRIVARYWDTADGAHLFESLYDKMLAARCNLLPMDDGSMRCAVDSPASIVPFYADDKCTTQLAVLAKSPCSSTPYVYDVVRNAGPCDAQFAVHQITSMTPVTAAFQKDEGGNCNPLTLPPDQSYVPIGPRVAPTDFVAYTENDEPLAPGLAHRVYTGEDGSRTTYVTPLADTTRGKGCGPSVAGDGKHRCLPDTTFNTNGLWSDMGCSAPVATDDMCVARGELVDISVIAQAGSDACNSTRRFFQIGAVRGSHDYYSGTPAMCTGPAVSPKDLYDLGAEIPASTFPELQYGPVGGTRLVTDSYQVGGVVIARDVTRDLMENDTCYFAPAADGVMRCLPNAVAAVGQFFSDMDCKVSVAVGDETCGHVMKYAESSEGEGCSAKTHVFALGTKSESATTSLWSTITGSCQPFMGSTAKFVWTLGAEVSAAGFPDGKLNEH